MSLGTENNNNNNNNNKKKKEKAAPTDRYGLTNSMKNIEWWKLGDEWWKLSDKKSEAKQPLGNLYKQNFETYMFFNIYRCVWPFLDSNLFIYF